MFSFHGALKPTSFEILSRRRCHDLDLFLQFSDLSGKAKQEQPVYEEEATVWNNNVIQEKEKSLLINFLDIPTSNQLVPKGDEGPTSSEQLASGSLQKQYPSGIIKNNFCLVYQRNFDSLKGKVTKM